MLSLLSELRAAVPEDLAATITVQFAQRPTAPLLDVEEADRYNASLRDLLAQAVRVLPSGAERERVRAYLLDRVQREPG